jgi:hypothetical protein
VSLQRLVQVMSVCVRVSGLDAEDEDLVAEGEEDTSRLSTFLVMGAVWVQASCHGLGNAEEGLKAGQRKSDASKVEGLEVAFCDITPLFFPRAAAPF